MKYYIGLDDTDNLESRGTGHLARMLGAALAQDFSVLGITRHQLLSDPRVPMTAKNSCACVMVEGDAYPLDEVAMYARKVMLDDYQPGSDPGLCVASGVPKAVSEYGLSVKQMLIKQQTARDLAVMHQIYLEGLGGTQDGVIGALAAVGLAALGEDGRYVQVGSIREMEGVQPVAAVLAAGITEIRTMDGEVITEGLVLADKLRPARRDSRPILFVEYDGERWLPLKLD